MKKTAILRHAPFFGHSRRDVSANVGVIFAFCLIPMIAFIGIGIDVSRAMMAKSVLDAAADAAALGAATKAEAILQSIIGTTITGITTAQSAGVAAGQDIFSANAAKAGNWMGGIPAHPSS